MGTVRVDQALLVLPEEAERQTPAGLRIGSAHRSDSFPVDLRAPSWYVEASQCLGGMSLFAVLNRRGVGAGVVWDSDP